MKDELISIETAKLAKEKGFDLDSIYAYTLLDEKLESAFDMTGNLEFTYQDIKNAKDNGFDVYLAPYQSLLTKWLRKKHDIIVDVFQESKDKSYTGYWKGDISYYMVYQEDELPEKEILNKDFTKALDLTLFEALKLIK